jgi:type VI secretion system protein ImpA
MNLLAEPEGSRASVIPIADDRGRDGFRKKFVDPYTLATAGMRAGEHQKAFEIMHEEIGRQRSGRGRFFRRLQLVQLCVSAGKEAIAQPILEDLISAADSHKIEEWEERETVADALATIMSASKKIQSDAKEKQKYFERICRLNPVKALATGA